MKRISYSGYRFPPEIIQQAIWLYFRFTLSLRDVEDLLAERGIAVSYESISTLGHLFRTDDRRGLAQASTQASHELAPR
jgi:transposase-like protein